MKALLLCCRKLGCSYQQSRLFCSLAARPERAQEWEAVIGLEIHAQILAAAKLFSGAPTRYNAPTNQQVAHFDAALPGTLPVINKQCVRAGVITALALNSRVNLVSTFDRKHYFYADLPAGYQITQQRQPLATGGFLNYVTWIHEGKHKRLEHRTARITQIQLEQDSGRSLHDPEAAVSLIDLNRAGVGLMEIVTEPDFRTAEEAKGFVRELQLLLQTIGSCDGNMQEGSMRVDASVSLRQPGAPLGTRAEVKNVNSPRMVAYAIDYEIQRQKEILESGGEIVNETRNYDFDLGRTVAMRDKERLHDYRFLPEPNLPPLRLYSDACRPAEGVLPSQVINVDELRRHLPPLPSDVRQSLIDKFGLSEEAANIAVHEEGFTELVEAALERHPDNVTRVANFVTKVLLGVLNERQVTLPKSVLTTADVLDIIDCLCGEKILASTAAKVLNLLLDGSEKSVLEIVQENDWVMINDPEAIADICRTVIQKNPKFVADYVRVHHKPKKEERLLTGLCRLVFEQSGGKVSLAQVTPVLRQLLLQQCADTQ